MQVLRRIAQACVGRVDALYRRRHRLQPVGPMLYVARARYPGPALRFADGTQLARGDTYGTLHFDNARIAALGEGSRIRTGVRFSRLLRQSFRSLAERTRDDPALRDVPVFQGITWIREHGGRLGITSEPLPRGARRSLLAAHFRLLRWVFAPSVRTGTSAPPEPRMFWLTRGDLLENFGRDDR
ncbi:MAG TPA: hypothetical protein VGA44_03025 [Steroidobacteraceae bacterium]